MENLLCYPIKEVDVTLIARLQAFNNKHELFSLRGYKIWFAAVAYLSAKDNVELQEEMFRVLEVKLTKINKKYTYEKGIGILPEYIYRGSLIRNLYRSQDDRLVGLLMQYLPIPPKHLFEQDDGLIPEVIDKRHQESSRVLSQLCEDKSAEEMEQLIRATLTIQRKVRSNIKQKEDIARYKNIYKSNFRRNLTDEDVLTLMRQANIPYIPKCKDRNLAKRIYKAAFNVPDIPTIRHLTYEGSITKILDGCFFGRKNLAAHYNSFRPASLFPSDRENGDANAICFGPQQIDDNALKSDTIEITYDMDAFRKDHFEMHNPCIFYKQKDLCFLVDGLRTVEVGDLSLSFSHTTTLSGQKPFHVSFKLYNGPKARTRDDNYLGFAYIPYIFMISNDLNRMSAIQSLQFFRFLDELKQVSNERRTYGSFRVDKINRVYETISRMTDEQLVTLLTELRNAMTDTAEFNFYGAYKLSPKLISKIKLYKHFGEDDDDRFCLDMKSLIASLQENDTSLLLAAKTALPTVFKSKTFLSYLITQVTEKASKAQLLELANESCEAKEHVMPENTKLALASI